MAAGEEEPTNFTNRHEYWRIIRAGRSPVAAPRKSAARSSRTLKEDVHRYEANERSPVAAPRKSAARSSITLKENVHRYEANERSPVAAPRESAARFQTASQPVLTPCSIRYSNANDRSKPVRSFGSILCSPGLLCFADRTGGDSTPGNRGAGCPSASGHSRGPLNYPTQHQRDVQRQYPAGFFLRLGRKNPRVLSGSVVASILPF
jgi:hypothetical protein